MSESIPEALHLTNAQKFYIKTALDMLAGGYEGEQQPQHASNCRMLAARIETHETPRRQPTPESTQAWQEKIMQTQGDPIRFQNVIREWIHELVQTAVDPAQAIADAMLPLADHTSTAQQTALQVLLSVEQKIMAMIRDPNIPDPDALFKNLIHFVHVGQARIRQGEPPWDDDPHLLALAKRLQDEQAGLPTPQ
jgi:hypothetical protein